MSRAICDFCSYRFRCEKPGRRSARVRRGHHRSQSVQMATLSRRHYHVVCALVSPPHLSVAQMGEMTRERILAISPSCVWRWVQA